MTKTIDAIYENGVLRPVEPLQSFAEGRRLRVTIDDQETEAAPGDSLPGDRHSIFDLAGTLSDEGAEAMLRAIQDGCEHVDPRDWE